MRHLFSAAPLHAATRKTKNGLRLSGQRHTRQTRLARGRRPDRSIATRQRKPGLRPRVKRTAPTRQNERTNLMIHAYHLIMLMYGFWLPNDPRGSWSDFVRKWELVRFGKATKSIERKHQLQLTPQELSQQAAARAELKYNPVVLTGQQAATIGAGFAARCQTSGYTIWACAILPEHTHLVIARHTYKVEQMARLLKGAATTQLIRRKCHPLADAASDDTYPRPWSEGHWKVYLDSAEQIETAIRYVNENPEKEDKPKQHWKFVTPFRGLDPGHITYH